MFETNTRPRFSLQLASVVTLAAVLFGCSYDSPDEDPDGGSRLTLLVDFDQSVQAGTLTRTEAKNHQAVLDQAAETLRERLDSFGLYPPKVYTEGRDRIVVELSGFATPGGWWLHSSLAAELAPGATNLSLDESATFLPAFGGVIRIDDEDLRYAQRRGADLNGLERGARGTQPALHAAGSQVTLVSDSAIKTSLERQGHLSFVINAEASDFESVQGDLASERLKLNTWLAAHPSSGVLAFNKVAPQDGGPNPLIEWYFYREDPMAPASELERATAVLRQDKLGHPEWVFERDSLAQAYASNDELGLPAVGFKMVKERGDHFSDFTDTYRGRLMSIAMDGRIQSTATIASRLPGSGLIYGSFTVLYVQSFVALLRTQPLKVQLRIISDERLTEAQKSD